MLNPLTHNLSRILTAVILMLAFSASGCHTAPVKARSQGKSAEAPQPYRPQDHGEITATDVSFDASTGEVRYTLPQDAYVRLRAGIRQAGALLRHVVDWEWRPAGPHTEVWDKKDASGLIDFGDRDDYVVILNAKPVKAKDALIKAPGLIIFFPDANERTDEGLPVTNGVVPLRILFDEKDRQTMADSKYEVALYVDLGFLMEDEVGTNPFNYLLDVSQFSEGRHVLTVNVIGYTGIMGTGTIQFYVKH